MLDTATGEAVKRTLKHEGNNVTIALLFTDYPQTYSTGSIDTLLTIP
jgi:hypothetical protein